MARVYSGDPGWGSVAKNDPDTDEWILSLISALLERLNKCRTKPSKLKVVLPQEFVGTNSDELLG